MNENDTTDDDVTLEKGLSSDEDTSVKFNLTSYGWDTDVEGLVKRLNRDDIHVPGFQRKYVWNTSEKSRFVESLILGLPVPSVFFAQDIITKKLNIVDGQQRLKSLQEYLSGSFSLSGKDIQTELKGCYFSNDVAKGNNPKVLSEPEQRLLSDALLHAVVIKPDVSHDDVKYGHEYNNAVIQVFKRLNTSGKPLQAQEVRACVFYGELNELLLELNQNHDWRKLFGKEHSRLKDVEAILRFCALFSNLEEYKSPMPRFLDEYMEDNRNVSSEESDVLRKYFEIIVKLTREAYGDEAFKKGNTFLLTKFDAVFVGAAKAIEGGKSFDLIEFKKCVDNLLNDKEYQWSIEEFVNDKNRVDKRIKVSISKFSEENK